MYADRTEKTVSEKDKTGIPRKMKTGFEHSSGFSFDDVRVHYNSEKPAQLHAHAYTQGNEVYVAPGQEKHLPHELGHVVQQKSDTVKPTGEIGGLPLNDDVAMEDDADMIAENAENAEELGDAPVQAKFMGDGVVQREHWLESSQGYNAMAGFGSAAVGMLGIIGGIGSFLYTKHNERKHRYIEEVEKYADAACDAQEEQIAAEQLATSEGIDATEKAKADAEKEKLKAKVERNYFAAIDKAIEMEKIKVPNQSNTTRTDEARTDEARTDEARTDEARADEARTDEARADAPGTAAPRTRDVLVAEIKSGNISSIKDNNVKNALVRANDAYDKSKGQQERNGQQ